jgi:hypothetical protein
MFGNTGLFTRLVVSATLIFALGFSALRAQDSELEDIKYKEDYDRIQAILKISDALKRGDRILSLYKDRPDMDPKLRAYVDSLFAMRSLCERAIKIRPRFGEIYLFQGIVFKNEKKLDEAMTAFARCYVIKNQFQTRAKQQLDLLFRAAHGSLIGQEKLIKEAMKGLK